MERTVQESPTEQALIAHAENVELQRTDRIELINRYQRAIQELGRAMQDLERLDDLVKLLWKELAPVLEPINAEEDEEKLLEMLDAIPAHTDQAIRTMDSYTEALNEARERLKHFEEETARLKVVLEKKSSNLGAMPIAEA